MSRYSTIGVFFFCLFNRVQSKNGRGRFFLYVYGMDAFVRNFCIRCCTFLLRFCRPAGGSHTVMEKNG